MVHFAYGSKPKKAFKETERKQFVGLMGWTCVDRSQGRQHFEFFTQGKVSLVFKKFKQAFCLCHTYRKWFLQHFSDNTDSEKRAIVYIPITQQQIVTVAYLKQTPNDYAFLGRRCGTASYEILSQLKIAPTYSNSKRFLENFLSKN